ncbi:MAG: rhomboid family intramembrane serine protease, partial [Candidatus Eremiobacterota bacterium]
MVERLKEARTACALGVLLGAAFAAQVLSGGELTRWGARDSYYFLRPEPYRLLSSVFLHANFLHLASNLLSLVTLGLILEPLLGGRLFLALFVVSG